MSSIRYSKITIRQPAPLKTKIAKAAAIRGMTVTSYINGVLEAAAERTVSRARTRELSERDSRLLMSALSRPQKPNAALRKAARRYAEFTRG